jgi:hypothetical protein
VLNVVGSQFQRLRQMQRAGPVTLQ